jgi:hypothetical protein
MRGSAATLLLMGLISRAAFGQVNTIQTDWSGGPDVFGPVSQWGDQFLAADGAAWRPIPGQLALACTPRDQPVQHLIAGDATHPRSCAVGDIDGDGDVDVLTCSPAHGFPEHHGLIYWWERQPNRSWLQHLVTEDFYGAKRLNVADVDRDGDLDVLAAAYYGDENVSPEGWRNGRYAWFENVSRDGSAWTQHLVGELYWGAQWIDAGDLDGDGDIDVVGASELTDGVWEQDGDITWFENVDGAGLQWTHHNLETEDGSSEAHVADLDGDGDLDVVGAETCRICWFENRYGDGSFWIQRFIDTQLQNNSYLDVGDLDDDGDLDVVGGAYDTSYVIWWENTAGSGTVWFPRYVVTAALVEMLQMGDIDGDGDLDVALVGGSGAGFVYWVENLSGDGVVWNPRLITNNVDSMVWLALGDVNADGRLDAAVCYEGASDPTHQLTWHDLTWFNAQGDLLSSVLERGTGRVWGHIAWGVTAPGDTGITVQVRGADDPYDLGPFLDVEAPGDDLAHLIDPDAQYFQYRLILASNDVDVSPILREIDVEQYLIADLDGDGCVGLSDLAMLLAEYGCTSGCAADLDGDGDVDLSDLSALLAVYGTGCL